MNDALAMVRDLRSRAGDCMLIDRRDIRRRLSGIERAIAGGREMDAAVLRIGERVERSCRVLAQRAAGVPRIAYPEELPVSQKKDEIARAIESAQVVVVCGETGSGKSTQLPKICLEMGRGVAGMIGHTQPRRIAARSVASRVAEELGSAVGGAVGYKVRFGDQTGPGTYIKVMTDGILLAETQGDRMLEAYDTIIVDEAHERSLNIDFLLGYLRLLLPRRPDLKVIITSATIDPKRLSGHFAGPDGRGAPIVEVSGRTYPVEVRYRAAQVAEPEEHEDEREEMIEFGVVDAVKELAAEGPGDILVFFSGEREIHETAELLERAFPRGVEVLPLYARLSGAEQMRVFKRPPEGSGVRRIVLATNVAETSVTVPGIRYVVDTGQARISRYSPRTKVQRLPIEAVSQASADQRKGRCGRLGPGVCIRLYSEADYQGRARFTEPEVLRTNLASVILQMAALNLGKPADFPFVDPPDDRLIRDGYDTLFELGAIDDAGELTGLGRELSRLPIDPRIGRMILAAREEHCLTEVLVIAAALSVQDPRERPMERAQEADASHARFRDPQSDFVGYLRLWAHWQKCRKELSGSRVRKMCRSDFLSYVRLREWEDVHRQLSEMAKEMGCRPNTRQAEYEQVHRALLAGLLSTIGRKTETPEYAGARDTRFYIFPGSTLFESRPKWVMAAELVKTTRLYARCAAGIKPLWIERAAPHLVKRTHSAPWWDASTARVMAPERVTLFGLEVIAGRQVHFGPIDPVKARAIFIHHGLVEGAMITDGEFARHNQELIERVRRLEAKARRPGLLAEVGARFEFFDKRIPPEVYSGEAFERWRRFAEKGRRDLLFMTEADVLAASVEGITAERFPDQVMVGGTKLNLTYTADPVSDDDGVTLTAPVETLATISEKRGDWLVPGLLLEKVEAMIRSLPKAVRVNFVPVPEYAARCVEAMTDHARPLKEAVAEALGRLSGVGVSPEAFKDDQIPRHLQMNYRVVDRTGAVLASGRDLRAIRRELAGRIERTLAKVPSVWNRGAVAAWDFGDLPESVQIDVGGASMLAFPALIDERSPRKGANGQSAGSAAVSLRLLPSLEEASARHAQGVRRLMVVESKHEIDRAVRQAEDMQQLVLKYATIGTADELRSSIAARACEAAFLAGADAGSIRTKAEFDRRLAEGEGRLPGAVRRLVGVASAVLHEYQGALLALEKVAFKGMRPPADDMAAQIGRLVFRGFLGEVPPERLADYPRYLRAIERRARKLLSGGAGRDAELMQQIMPRWRSCLALTDQDRQRAHRDPMLEEHRWMLEELRVSLFAQELGTKQTVSPQRLDRLWEKIVAARA
ncbi:MAG: ATP-dependent RNA helicase HrpA [Phycisphaeraceae bacterium]|nr:ATP-dependent RNA helicase HrpA [Phycisphaeraceae bacterium]